MSRALVHMSRSADDVKSCMNLADGRKTGGIDMFVTFGNRRWFSPLFNGDGGAGGGGSAGAGEGGSGAGGAGGSAGASGEGAGGEGKGGEGGGKGDGKVSFTPEQQAEVDRILGERLSKAQTKWEKDFQTKLDEAKTEAEKLAKMNADQKAEYERKKQEEAMTKRESEITRRELRATALETLAEKGMPKTLADILNYTDADSTNKSIESVEKAFREAVEAGVNERLKGEPPKGGGGKGANEFDEIKKIFQQR